MTSSMKIAGIVLALSVLLTGVGAVGSVGADSSAETAEHQDEVRIVDEEIVIADGVVTISDTTLRGPGLGDHDIDEREYTVDSTLRFDGFHVTYDGTEYTFCRITVHLEDVGIRLENVHITS